MIKSKNGDNFSGGSDGKESACMQETWVQSLDWEAPLEKEMAIHFSILAWRIPWIKEPDRSQSMESQSQNDWVTNIFTLSLSMTSCWLQRQSHSKLWCYRLKKFTLSSSSVCIHAQSCLTLCNSMNCSPPGSSVHGLLQARILEWVAISFSKGSSPPRDQTGNSCVSCIGRWILYHCITW